jgi:hypothetical protein
MTIGEEVLSLVGSASGKESAEELSARYTLVTFLQGLHERHGDVMGYGASVRAYVRALVSVRADLKVVMGTRLAARTSIEGSLINAVVSDYAPDGLISRLLAG